MRIVQFFPAANGPKAAIGFGAVCSKDVNGCFGPSAHKRAIAATRARWPPGAGGVGTRANATGVPRLGANGGVLSRGAIEKGAETAQDRQLKPKCRTRASAQLIPLNFLAHECAIVPGVTSSFMSKTSIPGDAFAASLAVWLYGVCSIARNAIANAGADGGACV